MLKGPNSDKDAVSELLAEAKDQIKGEDLIKARARKGD